MAFDTSTLFGGAGSLLSVGGGIFSALESSSAAKDKANSEKQIASLEMQADAQRRQAMELSARRQQLQTVRTAQQAQAMALSSATNQGAQFGSGLQGGLAGVSGQANFANLGVSQNLQFGENMFNINQQIDNQKLAIADDESALASAQGLGSMFSSLGKGLPAIMNLASLIPGA